MSYFFGSGVTITNSGGSHASGSLTVGNGKVCIDGVEYAGRNVVMNGKGVFIDGKEIVPKDGGHFKATSIIVEGNVAGGITTTSADVTVRDGVQGSVTTMSGDVTVTSGDVRGDVQTMSGDVNTGRIDGSVVTSTGDISKDFKRRDKKRD